LAWPPRCLRHLTPCDAVLGEPHLDRGQTVQLADPVQRFELGDESRPVVPLDGEQVGGCYVVLLGQLLVGLVAAAVPGPGPQLLRPIRPGQELPPLPSDGPFQLLPRPERRHLGCLPHTLRITTGGGHTERCICAHHVRDRLSPSRPMAGSGADPSSAACSTSTNPRPETADQRPWPSSGTQQLPPTASVVALHQVGELQDRTGVTLPVVGVVRVAAPAPVVRTVSAPQFSKSLS